VLVSWPSGTLECRRKSALIIWVIDIHCHILPDVDDGPKSWEVAEDMCHMAAKDGIEHIVATPHSNDRYFYDREYLSGLIDELRKRVGTKLKLSLGCDFHLSFDNMQAALRAPEKYCIGESQYMLVEFSNFGISPQVDEWFTHMAQRGVTPIITHPERNPIVQQSPQRVLKWMELGCAVQVTASVFTGSWGARARQVADWLLKEKAVHFLATDAHETERRVPILSQAKKIVAKQIGEERAAVLVGKNPAAVVNNQPLPYFNRN
jgi:protein-tyrosine phosphatase